jgi:hypothetical protein
MRSSRTKSTAPSHPAPPSKTSAPWDPPSASSQNFAAKATMTETKRSTSIRTTRTTSTPTSSPP